MTTSRTRTRRRPARRRLPAGRHGLTEGIPPEERPVVFRAILERFPHLELGTEEPEWREQLVAVNHVDNTGRLQSVARSENPLYYDLIVEFDDYRWLGKGNLKARTPTIWDEIAIAPGSEET
jgi:hypothetical protein